MRVTVVGCSGSFAGPQSPASCYLVEVGADVSGDRRTWRIVLDLGNGALGGLQKHVDPLEVDAFAISHLHPDHFIDLCGLYVYRRYHPDLGFSQPLPVPVYGPSDTAARIGAAYGLTPGESMSAALDVHTWSEGIEVAVGPVRITPMRMNHPVEAFGFRIAGPSSRQPGRNAVLAYTGDTDECPEVVELSRNADLLLSEAAFQEGRDDAVARGIHLTGRRAGRVAHDAGVKQLVLTHLPPWNDPAATRAEALREYAGPIELATTNAVYVL